LRPFGLRTTAERGLDESLGLAVGFGRVGLGSDVLELEPFAGAGEREGFVAGAVGGHAEACVVDDGGFEEGTALLAFSSGMMRVKPMREA
jgi:hypothetical protein